MGLPLGSRYRLIEDGTYVDSDGGVAVINQGAQKVAQVGAGDCSQQR